MLSLQSIPTKQAKDKLVTLRKMVTEPETVCEWNATIVAHFCNKSDMVNLVQRISIGIKPPEQNCWKHINL